MADRTPGRLGDTSSTSLDIGDGAAGEPGELERLRALVGPSEDSYAKLRQDVLGARDAARAAEAEAGRLRARILVLEADVARARRDFVWFRRFVVTGVLVARQRLSAVASALLGRLLR